MRPIKSTTENNKKKKVIPKKKEYSDEYLKYKSYIGSKKWKELHEWIFSNVYEKRCYCCGRKEGEDNCTIALHHNTYDYLYEEKELCEARWGRLVFFSENPNPPYQDEWLV